MSKKKKKEKDVEKKIKKEVKTAAKSLAAAGKAAVAKPKPPKPPKPAKKKVAKVITNEDVALRAYFIGERRQADGGHGDEHGDWVEAERQLRAEAAKK